MKYHEAIQFIGVLFLIFFIGFLGFLLINYVSNGYLTYFEDKDYCYNLFFDEYGDFPLYYGHNVFGECIYKFSDLEQDYTPFSQLKK